VCVCVCIYFYVRRSKYIRLVDGDYFYPRKIKCVQTKSCTTLSFRLHAVKWHRRKRIYEHWNTRSTKTSIWSDRFVCKLKWCQFSGLEGKDVISFIYTSYESITIVIRFSFVLSPKINISDNSTKRAPCRVVPMTTINDWTSIDKNYHCFILLFYVNRSSHTNYLLLVLLTILQLRVRPSMYFV